MTSLRGTDGRAARAVVDVAFAAFSDGIGPDAATSVLATAQRSIGADIGGFYSHEWRGWTTPLSVTPTAARRIIPYERVPTSFALPLHPGIRHLVRDRPTDPFRITDLVPDHVWQSSRLAGRMRPDWGRNQQLHIPVAPGVLVEESQVWVLGRTTSAFTDRDVDVARAITPVLTAVARHLAELAKTEVGPAAASVLTPREVVVLRLGAQGLSAAAVGLRLGISPRTVQKHLEHIHRKLGVHSRADALRACAELGIDSGR